MVSLVFFDDNVAIETKLVIMRVLQEEIELRRTFSTSKDGPLAKQSIASFREICHVIVFLDPWVSWRFSGSGSMIRPGNTGYVQSYTATVSCVKELGTVNDFTE